MIPDPNLGLRLPPWAQTAALNLASASQYWWKYGRPFRAALARLAANERKPREQLVEEQQAALHQMLAYARQHVPFYRELNLPPDDLTAWPVVDKPTVAAAPQRFLSDEFPPRRLWPRPTSGTTGPPLTVWFTRACYQTELAFDWRHSAWAGVPFLSRGAYLSGRPVVPPAQTHPPFWRKDFVEKRLLCSTHHLAHRHLAAYAQALAEWQPEFLLGYPSSLCSLAQARQRCRPRAVFTTGETLLEFQRTAITAAFGARIFNRYSNAEMTCQIIECAAGHLHERTDYGYLELDKDGMMLATGLNNRAMPLIRYRVGDALTLRPAREPCDCGCTFPLVERIKSQLEDCVRTPDGERLGRLDQLFQDVRHVREAQIVQSQRDELILRVVPAAGFTAQDEQMIRTAARRRLGDAFPLQVELVERIERTPSGKFQFALGARS